MTHANPQDSSADRDRADSRDRTGSLRASLRTITVAWLFGAAWMHLVNGAAFTRYAKLLNVTPFGFGLLAAIPFLGAVAQLPTSLFIERYGRRKTLFIWTCSLHRFLWLVIAAIPWTVPRQAQWHALVGLMLLSTVLANMAAPAWISWMADAIPSRIRGRYNARRIQYGQAVGLVLSLLAGIALDWPADGQGDLLRNVISAMFVLAGIAGMIDILLFIRVPDTAPHHRHPGLTLRELVRAPLANPQFRLFLAYSATITFATGYIGQFIWLYMFDVVGADNTRANLLLVTIPIAVSMVAYPYWGRMVDRFGPKPAILIAGIFVINGSSAWILVQGRWWFVGYLLVLTAVAAWPGMDLAGFNLLLRMSQSRSGVAAGSAAVAINSLAVAIAGTLSGLFGGAIAEWFGQEWRVTILGWPVNVHGLLFIISAALRALALGWIMALSENRAMATRDALRFIRGNVYSNLVQATFFPWRMVASMYRVTWRVEGAARRRRA